MSSSDSQEILNRIVSILNEFVNLELTGFDISEEKRLYLNSISVLFDPFLGDGIAVRYSLYLDNPVYILTLVSRPAVYEISKKMNIEIDTDYEKFRDNTNMLSVIAELVNFMTAAVADKYARRLNKRVLYSPPKIIKHIFSPDIIKGIGTGSRIVNVIVYEFILSEPESIIKMFLIY